jgi:3-oxoacyl-[acyl-carrier protein] reductase
MTDRYSSFTRTPIGKKVVSTLGLPNPVPLRRYRPGEPPLQGPALIGSAAETPAMRDAVQNALLAAGVDARDTLAPNERPAALVFDATGLSEPEDLVALHTFFSPRLRQLMTCGRVVVIGRPPADAKTESARIAQRALEGFTRSLGKEVGRGATANLVYVADGAEAQVASTIQFLLSARSAYVSGQVLRVGAAVDDATHVMQDADRPLSGKVAVVTGSSRGIGAAIAQVLNRDGATVVGVDVPAAASDLVRQARETGGSHLPLDITSVDAAERIARHAEQEHGGLDIVVHNAGITRDKRLVNMKPDAWQAVINVNLLAPQRLTDTLLASGSIRRGGRVIGVSSIAGIAGNMGQTNYAASKAGVIGLVDAIAPRAAEQGVTVNAVAPGFIETQMTAAVPLMIREFGRRLTSLSQGGLPVDVAETIAWLANPGSGGVNGTITRVCGQALMGA